MTPASLAVAVIAGLAAIPVAFYAGYSLAEWVAQRRAPEPHDMRARQALIDALTDPPPRRWR